jgi:large repetitive protein
MIRSFVARAGTLLASASLAFLVIAPVAVPSAQGKNFNFPDACSITVDSGGNVTMSCGSTPPGALSCAIVGAPSGQVAAGSPVSLTMSCSGGTPGYQYSWAPGGGTGATLATNVAATTTYSVTATDALGASSTKAVTVTVSSGGGGGGGGGTGLCANYANVLPTVNATFGQQASFFSQTSGSFGDNAVWVIQMTVPAGTPNTVLAGAFTTAEYNGPNTPRHLTISTQACDFRALDLTGGGSGPLTVCQDGSTCQIQYLVGPTPRASNGIAYLTAGQTYYINVRNYTNWPTPGYSCGDRPTCNALMNYQP